MFFLILFHFLRRCKHQRKQRQRPGGGGGGGDHVGGCDRKCLTQAHTCSSLHPSRLKANCCCYSWRDPGRRRRGSDKKAESTELWFDFFSFFFFTVCWIENAFWRNGRRYFPKLHPVELNTAYCFVKSRSDSESKWHFLFLPACVRPSVHPSSQRHRAI